MKKIYFKRNAVDHAMFQDDKTLTELPEMNDWAFVTNFYPNYYSCNYIMHHDDLCCYFSKQKTREEVENYNEDIEGLSEQKIKQYFADLDAQIKAETATNFYEMLQKGEIEIIYTTNSESL